MSGNLLVPLIQRSMASCSILVGADDDMIAGHARLMAARKLGMTEVPVIVLRHLSEAQRRALVIAVNQLAVEFRLGRRSAARRKSDRIGEWLAMNAPACNGSSSNR